MAIRTSMGKRGNMAILKNSVFGKRARPRIGTGTLGPRVLRNDDLRQSHLPVIVSVLTCEMATLLDCSRLVPADTLMPVLPVRVR